MSSKFEYDVFGFEASDSAKQDVIISMLEVLEGVLHHNAAVKPQYKLPISLIRQIKKAIKTARNVRTR